MARRTASAFVALIIIIIISGGLIGAISGGGLIGAISGGSLIGAVSGGGIIGGISGGGLIGAARAQDCPRGDLDKAYCDRDGDLVADPRPIRNSSSIRRR